VAPYLPAPVAAAEAPVDDAILCVVEFGNVSRAGDADLGAVAAARFTRSLARTDAMRVVEAGATLEKSSVRLAGAPGRQARAQLAESSGAGRVVYGTITSASVSKGRERRATVRMTVLVEEARSGRLLFGAVSEGVSAPAAAGTTMDRSALLSDALTNAAESFSRYFVDPEAVSSAAGPRVVCEGDDPRVQQDALQPTRAAQPTALLNPEQQRQRLADIGTPAPVVVDIPGGSLEGRRDPERRMLLSNKTLKMLVGGVLFMGLIYLAGAGGVGATRPF